MTDPTRHHAGGEPTSASRRITYDKPKRRLLVPSIGPMELIVVLIIALMVLGPKRLPQAGRSLGRGINEFKEALADGGHERDHGTVEVPDAPPPDRAA
jgi:sec-independent protein translocase protein TatA